MNDVSKPRTALPPWVKRRALEIAGWLLVAAGVAALVLPGPGLLCLVAGLALLSLRYAWAKRLLEPVKAKAFLVASQGVQTAPRILSSVLGALSLVGVGVVWGVRPAVPGWWPVGHAWWLPGGWGTGVTLIASGAIALGMIIYSFHRFHGHLSAESDLASRTPPLTSSPTPNSEETRRSAGTPGNDDSLPEMEGLLISASAQTRPADTRRAPTVNPRAVTPTAT